MNTLLIFFALPIATIILAAVLEKLIHCPIAVAAVFFAIYLIVTFAAFDATFLIATIVYTILAFLTALIVRLIKKIICRREEDDDNNECGCNCGCECNRNNSTNTLGISNSSNDCISGNSINTVNNCRYRRF